MCRLVMGQSVGDKCLVFSGTSGDARELVFAHLNRVVIEGSRGVGKRVKRQDEGLGLILKIFVRGVLGGVQDWGQQHNEVR